MYSSLPSFVLGFHGCDQSIGKKVLAGSLQLQFSKNDYDWLGNGIYFWENNPQRALEFATTLKEHPERSKAKIRIPFVVGAVIDLGRCLNLLESKSIIVVKEGYELLKASAESAGVPLPQNKKPKSSPELLLRYLDSAVIETVHLAVKEEKLASFDSVRAVFQEGGELYLDSGFREKNHIQICVRNPNCIKGYFLPRDADGSFDVP